MFAVVIISLSAPSDDDDGSKQVEYCVLIVDGNDASVPASASSSDDDAAVARVKQNWNDKPSILSVRYVSIDMVPLLSTIPSIPSNSTNEYAEAILFI